MKEERPTYLLIVRPEPGVDAVRSLRALLKAMLRTYGLKCVEITQREKEKVMVDARKYASKYIKPDQVRDGPIQTRIVHVFEDDRYGRPVLELEIGSQFTLNEGNNNILMKAWGHETDNWIGQELALELGTWKDWREAPPVEKETVRVRAISPGETTETQNGSVPASKPLPPSRTATSVKDDLNDDVPF
jgi:hypothetical protein